MTDANFAERIAAREAIVAVVGLGYVGLPLSVAFAHAGFPTIGLDVDAARVDALRAGSSHVDDVADADLAAVNNSRLEVTTDPARLADADVVFLCVPTPFDATKAPDLSHVRAAGETLAAVLRPGQLVILQSTTYPGTTSDLLQPILEGGSGLTAGSDFYLAYSPERVDPANERWTLANTAKICGGVTVESAERTRVVLEAMMGTPGLVTIVPSPSVAEMAKLAENTYRAVNIAYVNELAMVAHELDIDIWDVLDAAATKPFGYEPFEPGVGPGGMCIPVNPYYLSWQAREHDVAASFIELAGDINLRMASYVAERIRQFANRTGIALAGARVLCLGAAFKAGVSDVRNSRAVRVMEQLEADGAHVEFADPLVGELTIGATTRKVQPVDAATLDDVDLVVVLVRNPAWPVETVLASRVPVFDAVNALGAPTGAHHERL
jgi:UDP-N-acetyl-D-glucosamine dehydrogenase